MTHACGECADFSVDIGPASEQFPRNSEGDVVVLRHGRLLACWSRFYGGTADDASAQIAARLSADGGHTWGEPYVLQENIGARNVMSASLLRERASGDLLLLYGVKDGDEELQFYLRRSADDAASWEERTLVTTGTGYHVINNARLVQLSSGRLLAPDSFCTRLEADAARWRFRNVMHVSDDGGRSWRQAPGIVDMPRRGAMEPGVIELRDGRVLQIIRTQLGVVAKAYSADGGLTWGEPRPLGVTAPEAPSTIAREPESRTLVLFHNPTADPEAGHQGPRCPLSVSVSVDEGETWRRTVDLETDAAFTYAYLSCTFHAGRALLTYYVCGGRAFAGGLTQRFRSLPARDLLGG